MIVVVVVIVIVIIIIIYINAMSFHEKIKNDWRSRKTVKKWD